MLYQKGQWLLLTAEMIAEGGFEKTPPAVGDRAFVDDVIDREKRYSLVAYPSGGNGFVSEGAIDAASLLSPGDSRIPIERDLAMWNAVLDLYYGVGTNGIVHEDPARASSLQPKVEVSSQQMSRIINAVVTDEQVQLVVSTFKDIDIRDCVKMHPVNARDIDNLAQAVGISDRFIPELSITHSHMVKSDVNILAQHRTKPPAP